MPSPFVERLVEVARADRPAVIEDGTAGAVVTRGSELWDRALRAGRHLAGGPSGLAGRRVLLLVAPGAAFLEAFFGIAAAGGIAVPLSPLYPVPELAFFAEDAEADQLVHSADHAPLAEALAAKAPGLRRLVPAGAWRAEATSGAPAADLDAGTTALLLYTSGTTGRPKGARITHGNLAVQGALLREAWRHGPDDVLLHALPLHHLHGLGISLLTVLLAGATARLLPRFEATRVWDELAGATVFMGVPTMYQKLFEAFDAAGEATRARWTAGARALRLATSGSAALPVTLAERWRRVTGAVPLERFGMTEIGVGCSNPFEPEGRRAGSVGPALPTVELRLVGDDGAPTAEGPGELHVRGPSVIPGYWKRDEVDRASFVDGWFKTGDLAVRESNGYVRLLGRTSVDILKSGGYKLSALEIEEVLREHDAVLEVSVVGLPDATWGERVVAAVVPRPGRAEACTTEAIRHWAKERIAAYKVPREVVVLDALPRNAVGKVVKPDLVKRLLVR